MSKADIEYSTRTIEQLESLETEIAERIVSKLDDVGWNPEHYLRGRKMSGSDYYSLRIGDYRAIIDWQRNETPEVPLCPASRPSEQRLWVNYLTLLVSSTLRRSVIP